MRLDKMRPGKAGAVMTAPASFARPAIVGAGAWGTALAQLAASNGLDTLIWAREPDVVDSINKERVNSRFLPGAILAPTLRATSDLESVAGADAIIMVAPAQHMRAVAERLAALIAAPKPVLLCAKGIEIRTGALMSEVLRETWPQARAAALSGPSFAADVARGLPTAVTLAAEDERLGAQWAASLGAPHFRPYLTADVLGTELGGAAKNVIAIAAGIVDGKGLGESARAALVARGFAEIQRLGAAMGARPETLAGLSGLGDLILTASSPQSRNFSLGQALGQGRSLEETLGRRESVSEGAATANAIVQVAERYGVELPISAAVAALVNGARTVDELMESLLSRPLRKELGAG